MPDEPSPAEPKALDRWRDQIASADSWASTLDAVDRYREEWKAQSPA